MRWPYSNTIGIALAIVLAVVGLIALFTTGIGPVILGVALIGLVLYLVAIVAINIHRWSTTLYDRRRRR